MYFLSEKESTKEILPKPQHASLKKAGSVKMQFRLGVYTSTKASLLAVGIAKLSSLVHAHRRWFRGRGNLLSTQAFKNHSPRNRRLCAVDKPITALRLRCSCIEFPKPPQSHEHENGFTHAECLRFPMFSFVLSFQKKSTKSNLVNPTSIP